MDIFGERFKQLKEERGLTFPQIAKDLGVSSRMVQCYAGNEAKPDYWRFLAIADYFGVSLDYLAGRSDER